MTTDNMIGNPQAKWYLDLSSRFEELAEEIGLTEDQAYAMKVFALQLAKDQYMEGNRSGIKWARQPVTA